MHGSQQREVGCCREEERCRGAQARAQREPILEQLAAAHAEITELRVRALAAPARFEARVAQEEGNRTTERASELAEDQTATGEHEEEPPKQSEPTED